MNRREWVLYGQKELEEAQIENASGDAWYLFSECFHISREDYLFGMTDEINDQEAEERYKELIQKRKEHVPLQYILGTQEFMGYTFNCEYLNRIRAEQRMYDCFHFIAKIR